ncbi:unnamed protein product [Brachionus calyciflorus]|uniref:Uncharacterized protein n=1 Tax=Brachionus calyciflorus TaxID=104777 RepID=A0A813R3T4_9BILA|nr:unnamed protein product [Brachionus calyciflorus]
MTEYYKNNKYFLFVLIIYGFVNSLESLEPLNLNIPNEYDVPTETFILCDLSQEFLRTYCQNQGICYTLVDHTKKDQKSIYSISEIYCSCPNDFTGSRCEEKILSENLNMTLLVEPEPKLNEIEPFSKCPDISSCSIKCDYGYKIDENNCLLCECLSDILNKSGLVNTLIQESERENFETYCQNNKCEQNEICRYFDKTFFACPEGRANCKNFENFSKFPMCVQKNLNQICMEEVLVGSCERPVERFFFDPIEQKCKKFYYSGCLGNRNNFLTLQECSMICMSNQFINDISKINYVNKIENFDITKNTSNQIKLTTSKLVELGFTTKISTPTSFETISLPTVKNSLNESNFDVKSHVLNDPNSCQWVCDLNCPFGYKLNYRTKCYKCECIDLNMTECGVPCFPEGTASCLHSMRANSRPKCVCNPDYDGVYCQIYKKSSNFSARVERSIRLNQLIANDIKSNFTQKLSDTLDIGSNNIVVNEIRNNLKDNYIIIKFSVYAPDFSNSKKFDNLVINVNSLLLTKNLTLKILNQELTLNLNCDKTEDLISINLNENYLFSSNKLRNMIEDLKADLMDSYKFPANSIQLVKLNIEPQVELEVLLKNNADDPEFCLKSHNLKIDLRSKDFMPQKFNIKYLSTQNSSIFGEKRFIEENYLESLTSENLYLSRNSDLSTISHLTSSVFLNHSIAYLSVIASSFFIIVFVVSLFIITQLKRRQNKKIAKFDDSDINSTFENYEKTEFRGYFMPNYATVNAVKSEKTRSTIEKLGVY